MRFRLAVKLAGSRFPESGEGPGLSRARTHRARNWLRAMAGNRKNERLQSGPRGFQLSCHDVSPARLTSGDYERGNGEANELVIRCRRLLCVAYVNVRFRKVFRF